MHIGRQLLARHQLSAKGDGKDRCIHTCRHDLQLRHPIAAEFINHCISCIACEHEKHRSGQQPQQHTRGFVQPFAKAASQRIAHKVFFHTGIPFLHLGLPFIILKKQASVQHNMTGRFRHIPPPGNICSFGCCFHAFSLCVVFMHGFHDCSHLFLFPAILCKRMACMLIFRAG